MFYQNCILLIFFFTADRGFSIGIDDVQPTDILNEEKQKVTDEHFSKCKTYLQLWKNGKFEATPGSTVEATLEVINNS